MLRIFTDLIIISIEFNYSWVLFSSINCSLRSLPTSEKTLHPITAAMTSLWASSPHCATAPTRSRSPAPSSAPPASGACRWGREVDLLSPLHRVAVGILCRIAMKFQSVCIPPARKKCLQGLVEVCFLSILVNWQVQLHLLSSKEATLRVSSDEAYFFCATQRS